MITKNRRWDRRFEPSIPNTNGTEQIKEWPSSHELSPHKRACVCALRDAGFSYPEISDREGIIVPTCKSTFKK